MTYGPLPSGFARKELNTTLAEIQASMRTEFGPNVIMSPQSPFGQLNGLMAVMITQLWEMAEDVYQSYDVDQAEGARLDILGKIRLLGRMANESDASYRQAISNQDRARIDVQDIARAVASVDGVTFSHVWVNDATGIDPETGLTGGSLAVAVLGGDDEAIADVLRGYVVPGVSLYGNTYVSTTEEGYCRTMALLRPSLTPIKLVVTIVLRKDAKGCPPPALLAIEQAIVAALAPNGSHELLNGTDITFFLIRSIVEALWPHVEVVSIVATADGHRTTETGLAISFQELATLAIDDLKLVVQQNTTGVPRSQTLGTSDAPPPVVNPLAIPGPRGWKL